MWARMLYIVFFFNDTATTEIYTLSLHDALPIWVRRPRAPLYSPHARQPLLHRPPPSGPLHGARLREPGDPAEREGVRSREPLPVGQRQADGRARPVRHPLAGAARRLGDGLSLVHHRDPRARQGRR